MPSSSSYGDVVGRLTAQTDAVGRLAQDSGGFAAVVAALEARDPNAFRWTLERLGMLPQCKLICEWVLIKLCVLRCIEVCGPPREKAKNPDLKHFARAIVRLASDEKLLRRVVDAVSCANAEEYRAALNELELNEFCHLLCHWVCSIIYRRVCEVVCTPQPPRLPDPVNEIRAAAKEIERLLANEKAFNAIAKGAAALDCATVQSTIKQAGFVPICEIICELICVWRCVLACLELCENRAPLLPGTDAVEEARNFALASRQLASHPRALGDLVLAVQNRNAKAFGEIIARFGLAPYCFQVCAWVCSSICFEFCYCVCPNPALYPWFTTVGDFDIYADIDGATGKTNKSLAIATLAYGGGPNFAFFEQLQLGGWCPAYSPTSPGTQMMYRFLFSKVATTLASAINTSQTTITVASSAAAPPAPFDVSVCGSGGTGETMRVTGVSGTTWTVARGQDGTMAATASAGASVWINPTPIMGNLLSPVVAGTRIISWPQNVAGIAGAALVPTFQSMIVASAPTPPDPTPPAPGAPWVGPAAHYINPDPTSGWIDVDVNAVGGGFATLIGFDTTQPAAAPGGDPLPGAAIAIGTPGGVPAGSAVPAASQQVGTDMTIIFQATRVGITAVDYSNSLCMIHVNNWSEVNNLWFLEFGSDCCTPIDTTLSVQFTTDHEEMSSGEWSAGDQQLQHIRSGQHYPGASDAGSDLHCRGQGSFGNHRGEHEHVVTLLIRGDTQNQARAHDRADRPDGNRQLADVLYLRALAGRCSSTDSHQWTRGFHLPGPLMDQITFYGAEPMGLSHGHRGK